MSAEDKLSKQMNLILKLVRSEGLTVRQINDRLFKGGDAKARRVHAASMSRSLRRLRQRGLIQ